MNRKIMSIETSCDETSIAIINEKKEILSLVTNTQVEFFEKIGGVVPELASRMHVDNIFYVYKEALTKACLTIDDIDYIAVTNGPGLIGALLVGVNFAKSLSKIHNIPIISVNHLIGHICAIDAEYERNYPHLSLIVSGGHTELIYSKERKEYKKIGQTLDDAAGESFDKVARILNLGYPGGPKIDKIAKNGVDTYDLPMPKNDNTLDFSFSGLKSACFNLNNQLNMKNIKVNEENFACSFQNRVNDTLINKIKIAMNQYEVKDLSVVGGVSANSDLRAKLINEFSNVKIPNIQYSTDNAVMIAFAALENIDEATLNINELNADTSLEIEV